MGEVDWKYLYTTFDGRIGRKMFWIGAGGLFVAHILNLILFGRGGLVPFVVSVVIMLAGLGVFVKRCHDRDKSGWWCLLLLIPYVNIIWTVVDLGILEGTKGPNQYGPEPPA